MTTKTNAMRILDSWGIKYILHDYSDTAAVSGREVSEVLNIDPDKMFKTLVTTSTSKRYYVFLVPISAELDLKNAAREVGEKAVEMIKSKDLLALTGYVHWWCSPIGMKKQFPTVVDSSAEYFDTICFSWWKIGYTLELDLREIENKLDIKYVDIIK